MKACGFDDELIWRKYNHDFLNIQNFINFFIRGNLININILGAYLIAESRMPGFMRCGASDVVHASWRQAPAMGAYLPDSLNLDLNMFPKYYFAKMRNSDFKI